MTAATGSAICPFCVAGNAQTPGNVDKAHVSGSIVTPDDSHSFDLSEIHAADASAIQAAEAAALELGRDPLQVDRAPARFQALIDRLHLHRRWDGRPVIEHLCPVAGGVIHLYVDVRGGSHFAEATAAK